MAELRRSNDSILLSSMGLRVFRRGYGRYVLAIREGGDYLVAGLGSS